jgi:hypothetical protein
MQRAGQKHPGTTSWPLGLDRNQGIICMKYPHASYQAWIHCIYYLVLTVALAQITN